MKKVIKHIPQDIENILDKFSDGMILSFFGLILICIGWYEPSNLMFFIGLIVLLFGLVLHLNNRAKMQRQLDRVSRFEKRHARDRKSIEDLEDATLQVTQDMAVLLKERNESKEKLERYNQYGLAILRSRCRREGNKDGE